MHLVTDELEQGADAGRRRQGRAAAAAGRLRARHHLRRRGRPDDRRAPGQPAGHRSRRGRDVSRLRRHRAGPLHRHDHLPGGRRLGGADAARAPRSSTCAAGKRRAARASSRSRARCWSTRATIRHFMAKEIHEQPEVISHTLAELHRLRRPDACICRDLGIDLASITRSPSRPAAPPTTPACRQILVRALCAAPRRDRCRLRVPLPRAAAREGRPAPVHLAVG